MTFRTKRLWMQNHVVNTNENNCYYNIFLQKRSHESKPQYTILLHRCLHIINTISGGSRLQIRLRQSFVLKGPSN